MLIIIHVLHTGNGTPAVSLQETSGDVHGVDTPSTCSSCLQWLQLRRNTTQYLHILVKLREILPLAILLGLDSLGSRPPGELELVLVLTHERNVQKPTFVSTAR